MRIEHIARTRARQGVCMAVTQNRVAERSRGIVGRVSVGGVVWRGSRLGAFGLVARLWALCWDFGLLGLGSDMVRTWSAIVGGIWGAWRGGKRNEDGRSARGATTTHPYKTQAREMGQLPSLSVIKK